MNAKIVSLKKAYKAGDRARIIKAARALLSYNKRHPMAIVIHGGDYVRLASRIVSEF